MATTTYCAVQVTRPVRREVVERGWNGWPLAEPALTSDG
jgi:hypothetical protein